MPFNASLTFEELLVLARHISRTSGFISLKTLGEHLPGVDMGTNVQILESLIRSRHIQRTKPGYYTFMPNDFEVEAEELESELKAMKKLKSRLTHGNENYLERFGNPVRDEEPEVCLSSQPSDEELRNVSSTEWRSFYAEELQNLSLDDTPSFADKVDHDEGLTSVKGPTEISPYSRGRKRTFDDVGSYRVSSKQHDSVLAGEESEAVVAREESAAETALLDPSAPEFMPSSVPVETPATSSELEPQELPSAGAAPEPSRVRIDLLPPTRKARSVTFSPELTSSVASSRKPLSPLAPDQKNRGETENKFHWIKKKTGDEVDDPCGALEIFCRYNNLKPPSYNVIFMPQESVYLCKLLVGSASFKSYPAMSRTRKRAMEVAAEEAVKSLGLTASMIARFAGNQDKKFHWSGNSAHH